MSVLSHICPNFYSITLNATNNYDEFTTDPNSYAEILREIRLKVYIALKWKGYHGFNVYYIAETLTDVGYCQTFNLLNSTDIFDKNVLSPTYFEDLEIYEDDGLERVAHLWSPDTGYEKVMSYKTFPLRSLDANANLGFNAEISVSPEDLTVPCERETFGYKVFFHNPHEWPEISKNHIQMSHNRKYNMVIKPQITKTANSLKSYLPEE